LKQAGADVKDAGAPLATTKDAKDAAKTPEVRAPPPVLVVKQVSDADLEQGWQRWKKAEAGSDFKAEQAARADLLALKEAVGATDLDSWAMGLLRLSSARAARGDSGAAVEIAISASQLAPSLPSAWVGLSRAYFQADPTEIGRVVTAMATGVARQLQDPRFSRSTFADVAAVALFALVLTAMAVLGVLFVRRAYFFFYDFHFFFPRVASRWQTTALAVLLLSVPMVFRMGVVPSLLGLFTAATLYLSVRERVVAAVLIAALGVVPTLAGLVVERAAFAGTSADELFTIERGGPGSEALAQKYEGLAAAEKVGFSELFVLGHHHMRRGRMDQAVTHFRRALALNPQHVGTSINLGVCFFLQGDLENSRSVLEGVVKANPGSSVALFDLGRIYQRRVQVYGDQAAGEVDRALKSFSDAAQLDPTLPRISLDDKQPAELVGNALVRSVGLERDGLETLAASGDAAERVRSQLTLMLLGDLPAGFAPFFPGLLAALLVGFGALAGTLRAARECTRCGKAVSSRGDPDVSPGSMMCTQCVNVFAKKNVVAPSLKVRKQLEVARYLNRIDRTGFVFGALWSGMGHVFSGLPVRGALYGFVFVAALAGSFLRGGLLRTPYEDVPAFIKLVPLVGVALTIYIVSFRALRKKQG
jgi:tetratricopeptide (TPR) repeat protein